MTRGTGALARDERRGAALAFVFVLLLNAISQP
jgi:hypothetical protein